MIRVAGMMSLKRVLRRACVAPSLALLCAACANLDGAANTLPVPDGRRFVDEVYPVLLRDCAFSSCHGSPDRFLRVVGPGRPRLDPDTTEVNDPLTYDEVLFSYERARSMLSTAETATESLLLKKPLEFSAGGQGHRGADDYGRNVYSSTNEPGFSTLQRWAYSRGLPPSEADVAHAATVAQAAQLEFDDHFTTAQERQP